MFDLKLSRSNIGGAMSNDCRKDMTFLLKKNLPNVFLIASITRFILECTDGRSRELLLSTIRRTERSLRDVTTFYTPHDVDPLYNSRQG